MNKKLGMILLSVVMLATLIISAIPVSANDIVTINIDIKPGSDPNSVNVKSKGVLPVAILGSADFDTTQVNAPTVLLSWDGISGGILGVSPLRWDWEDVNSDGLMDIALKYSMDELATLTVTNEPPGPLTMTFMGYLMDYTPIEGYDTVFIINKINKL